MKRLGLAVGALGLLLLNACSEAPQTTSTNPTFSSLYSSGMFTTCQNCHFPGGSAGVTLDMTSESNAYTDLTTRGVQIPSNPSQCSTVKRVVAGDPAKSYLLAILFSDYNGSNVGGAGPCTAPSIHHGYANLSSSEKSNLVNWIAGGANK